MIRDVTVADTAVLAAFYAAHQPKSSVPLSFSLDSGHHGFVAVDSSKLIVGFALVLYLDLRAESFGIIYQLQVAPRRLVPDCWRVRDDLVTACASWVRGRGSELIYAREVDPGARTLAMIRYGRDQIWRMDPEGFGASAVSAHWTED